MKQLVILASACLLQIVQIASAQTYDPFAPYSYQKSDTTQPVTMKIWSLKGDRTEWSTTFTLRDQIVYEKANLYTAGKTYYLLGWRGTYNFCYTKVETMKESTPTEFKTDGDVELKQYDVRDFYSVDAHIIKDLSDGRFQLKLYSWVPGGIQDYYSDGKPSDCNNQFRIYKACKERDHESGKLIENMKSCSNFDGEVSFLFASEREAEALLAKIKLYGKKSDPYTGDPNPYTFTIDYKTNQKITLKKEDLLMKFKTNHDFLFVRDGLVWVAMIDSTRDETTKKWKTTAELWSIPLAHIDVAEYQRSSWDRGYCFYISLQSKTEMVVNHYSFGQNRRGICSAYIGKKDKELGYRGADAIFFYMDKEEQIRSFLAKIGKAHIPLTNLDE